MSKLAHRLQATCSTLLMAATGALAQNTPEAANLIQQRYESAVAACNSAGLPAPAREACVRDAGTAADRARGGPPAEGLFTTPDGRATVITPPPSGEAPPASIAPPEGAAGTRTTPDGRATIVPPPTDKVQP